MTPRRWTGTAPLVIGIVDDETGAVTEEIVVQPGDLIPRRALELLREAETLGGPLEVPYDGVYSRGRVRAAAKWIRPKPEEPEQ